MGKEFAEPAVKGRDKTEMYRKGISQKEATAILTGLLGADNQTMLRNIRSGEEVRLSKSSIGKLLSNAAVAKSMNNGFTREQHYAVASDIDNLFANSVKVLIQPDKYGNPDVIAMHRFSVHIFGNNTAYITVKETKEQGKRMYSVELIEMG